MALLPPRVVVPLSECSSFVRVQGQLTGSTVDVFANGVRVGGGGANWSDQSFPLNAGVALAAGAQITATQTMGGQVSSPSTEPVVVQARPNVVGYVGLRTHLYICGQCLWLDGMVPGATVEVRVGGVQRGVGRADDGSARIGLTAPTGFGEVLEAHQTACGIPGPVTPLPPPDSIPLPHGQRFLPPPTVQSPLKACQRRVTVSDVFEGAEVTLERTGGPNEIACFDLSSLWFPVPPLVQGEQVAARQDFPKCELQGLNSSPITVGPPQPVPAPTVVPPLCDGSTTVRLSGLLAGSQVRIFQDGIELGTGEAPDTQFDFEVPPLAGGSVITAEQELCKIWSIPSNRVTVNPRPAALPVPVVPGPLYECAAAVRVTNLHPGSGVYVYSTTKGAPIGWKQVFTTQADIPVAPQLIAGDDIYAVEIGCGLTVQSARVRVQALPHPVPPQVVPPVDDCMRSVTVANVIPGARVDVYINNAWRGTAFAGTSTVDVPILFGPLYVGDQVKARQRICQFIAGFGEPVIVVSHVAFSYLTQHFEDARTGWNPYETTLTIANVPQLRRLFAHKVDGQVYAQPLYMHHVAIPDQDAHNIVFVATEADSVYAFDADTKQPALWHRTLVPPGESPLTPNDLVEGGNQCTNISPHIGITGTPVIDCGTYTMYVVAKTKRISGGQTSYHQYLHALDIATGADRPNSPVEIQASIAGTGGGNDGRGHVIFLPQWQLNRPALLLANGIVYLAFSAHCDFHIGEYHGWLLGYDLTTLVQVGAFNTTPDSSAAGVWQSGMGPAADQDGNIFFATGNGRFNGNTIGGRDYGDSVIRLRPNLTLADYFTPADQPDEFKNDWDLGSGGPLVLPDQPGKHSKLLVMCGKVGDIFLLDRQNLGGYTTTDAQVVQKLQLQPGKPKANQPGVWGGPAYYHGPSEQFIYYCGNGDRLKAFHLLNGLLTLATVGGQPNQSPTPFPREGGATPVVSSNQQLQGTGVVWALARSNPLRLRAYDATNLTAQLFDANAGPWNNKDGGAFIEPTVINGKVYVGSDGQFTVFGL